MALNNPPWAFILLVTLMLWASMSSNASDSDALLKFKESLANNTALDSWNASTSPCTGNANNWYGVLCFNGNVHGLQLEKKGLMGMIDVDALVQLRSLRTLSFTDNNFDGAMPDIKKLSALRSIFLWNNSLSGEIPSNAFVGMSVLKKVNLANNKFRGQIPLSLIELPKLSELSLEGNQFEGKIPDFQQKELGMVNVSNNQLKGPIPASLSKMDPSCFLDMINHGRAGKPSLSLQWNHLNIMGNKDLCGKPLEPCKSSMN